MKIEIIVSHDDGEVCYRGTVDREWPFDEAEAEVARAARFAQRWHELGGEHNPIKE